MGLEDFNLSSVDVEPLHFFQSMLQVISRIETNFATALANSLMCISVGDFSALSENVLQLAPAATRRQIIDSQTVSSSVRPVTATTVASP